MGKRTRHIEHLTHILCAMTRIRLYTKELDKVAFCARPIVQDAVMRNIAIIVRTANDPSFPGLAATARNALSDICGRVCVDNYRIDAQTLWHAIENDLPLFERLIEKLIAQEKAQENER